MSQKRSPAKAYRSMVRRRRPSSLNFERYAFCARVKTNAIETLTQCAEWSQFALQHFLEMWPKMKKLQPFYYLSGTSLRRAPWTGGVGLEHCSDAVSVMALRAPQRDLYELYERSHLHNADRISIFLAQLATRANNI